MTRRNGHRTTRPTNPLFLVNPNDLCDTCGTRVVDPHGNTHPCPFGPHDTDPLDAA